MSKLTALCGKIKEDIELKDQEGNKVTITLKAPKMEDLSEISVLFKAKKDGDDLDPKQMNQIIDISKKMIKRSEPDVTDEEIDEIYLNNFEAITTGVVNLLNKSFNPTEKK